MSGWSAREVTHLERIARRMEDHRARLQAENASALATIDALREQGCPWSVIGEALGVTKQAAQQRYGNAAPGKAPTAT